VPQPSGAAGFSVGPLRETVRQVRLLNMRPSILLCLLIILLVEHGSVHAAIAVTPKTVQSQILTGHNGRHRFKLHLVAGPFRKERHRIEHRAGWARIDGHYYMEGYVTKDGAMHGTGHWNWYGTDGGLPYGEFYAFDVWVDGTKWKVPYSLYHNCYNPNVMTSLPYPMVKAWLSQSGRRLTIKMAASDGAGSYRVIWHLRKNGKHGREISFPD